MKEFQELHQAVINDRRYSLWSKQQTITERIRTLQGEVQELSEALHNENITNFQEELGDVIWDTLSIAAIAEEKGLFTTQEVLHNVILKFKQRKPFIFTGESVSKEEESRIWQEAKNKGKA